MQSYINALVLARINTPFQTTALSVDDKLAEEPLRVQRESI
jgi:hypothetical protein